MRGVRSETRRPKRHDVARADAVERQVQTLLTAERYRDAEPLAAQLVETRRHLLGAKHRASVRSLDLQAQVLDGLGDHARATKLLEQVIQLRSEMLGSRHPGVAVARYHLARVLIDAEDYDRAVVPLQDALDALDAAFGPQAPEVPTYLNGITSLVKVSIERGDIPRAEASARRACELHRARDGARSPKYATALANLALVLLKQEKAEDALPVLQQATGILQKSLGAQDSAYLGAQGLLAQALGTTGQYDAAERIFDGLRSAYAARYGKTSEE
jgi:tetratricopeptide (TPR) repeat protein